MPTIMFLFSIFLILIFQKQTRKYLLPFVVIFSLIFSVLYKSNETIRIHFTNFYNQVSKIAVLVLNKDFSSKNSPQYLKEFSSFYDTWLMNKYIGGGIKNFRYFCHVRPNIDPDQKFICNMHPHNYYLHIASELGLFGIFFSISIFSVSFPFFFCVLFWFRFRFSVVL